MEDVLRAALDAATAEGATYADARAVETKSESLSVRGPLVEALDRSESVGFGVRVIADGAWGYAATAKITPREAARVAAHAVEVARASSRVLTRPVELVPEPAHKGNWSS